MAGSVTITPNSVSVVPGEQATASVRIRNTGTVVDQFSVSVLGPASVWTTAVPAVLSLFPGADGTIDLHFAPPRTADLGAGGVPFGVRVDASQDPDGSVVEEGEVDLLPFLDVQAKITPRTSEAKKTARHDVLVDNRGNSPIEAEITATDPDEVLAFDVKPRTVSVAGGQSVHVPVKVVARKGFLKGTDKHRPFQVRVSYAPTHPPILLDGTLLQKPGMPKFIVPLVGAAVVLALVALVLPAMKKDDASGRLSLTSEQGATTTTEAAGDAAAEEPVDPNAPATAEEAAAAAAAEAAANGRDADAPAGGGGSGGGGTGGGTSAAGGGTATAEPVPEAGGGVVNGNDDAPVVTSPPATAAPPPPATSTTAPPAGAPTTTTTTVVSKDGAVRGTWTYDLKAGVEGASSTADFWWEIWDTTTRWVTPRNGAMVSNMGVTDYDAVTLQKLQTLSYTSAKIVGSDSGNQMPIGTVIAFKTTTGKFAKLKVVAKEPHPSNKLTFRYFVYP